LKFEDDPEVHIHRRTQNQGLAKAVAYGIEHSTKEFCAVMDSDLQHPPEKLTDLLLHAEDDVDLVIASRHTDFGRIEQWPASRRVVSLVATGLTKILLPETRSISDPLSGFFLIRRSIVDDDVLHPSGYKILLELIVRCNPNRVVEVPYVFRERERGESKLSGSEYTAFLLHILSLTGGSE
jgi:dolichol-phosphate mannosyltransferase